MICRRQLATIALATSVLSPMTASAEPQARLSENQIKAAFLFNVAKFVEWPATDDRSDDFVVGVIGSDFIGNVLYRLVSGKTVQGREIVVRRLRKDDDLQGCQIVFVGANESRHAADILLRVQARGVLTVGETPQFLSEGGLVRFYVDNNRIRFQINAAAAEQAGLKINSQLMGLARP